MQKTIIAAAVSALVASAALAIVVSKVRQLRPQVM